MASTFILTHTHNIAGIMRHPVSLHEAVDKPIYIPYLYYKCESACLSVTNIMNC